MTSPQPPYVDGNLVARLSQQTAAMGSQLNEMGHGLAILRAQLDAVARYTQPAQASAQQSPAHQMPVQQMPAQQLPRPTYPMSQPRPTMPPQPPRAPVPNQPPWWQRDGVISRLLAIAGAGVTLIGVVMLLVLAAQAGFFGPVARVAAGAVLSASLVLVAFRVYGRPGGRVGAISLAATGFAGGYLDVVAMTTIYDWIPEVVGLSLALVIASLGVTLAVRWDAQQLAIMSLIGVAILAPVVTDGITLLLIAFLVILQAAAAPVHVVKSWPYLHIARTAPVVLALAIAIAAATTRTAAIESLIGAVVVAAIGIASGLVSVRKHADDVAASVVLAVSTLPLMLWAVRTDEILNANGWAGITVAVAAAVVLSGLALVRALPSHTRISALIAGVLATFEATVVATNGDTLMLALLAVSCGYLAVAGTSNTRIPFAIGLGFAAIGGIAFLEHASPEHLASRDFALNLDGLVLAASVVALAVAALAVWAGRRLGLDAESAGRGLLVVIGFAVLYVITAATVTTGVLIGGDSGFTAGHMAATIIWMGTAATLLLWGLRTPKFAHGALLCGLSLTAASVAKLFLYDLAALDGILRVAAFIVVGLLLLVVGTRYAREFADRNESETASV